MIELREFDFPAGNYYRLVLRRLAVRYGWFFVYGCSVTGALALLAGYVGLLLMWVVITGVLFPLSAFFTAWKFVYAKENAAVLQKRKLTFDPPTFHILCEDGAESRVPLTQISRVETWHGYYLLYITKHNYIPVPMSAFVSEDDRQRFEAEVTAGKWKKPTFVKHVAIYLLITAALLAAGYSLGHRIEIVECPSVQENGTQRMGEP